MQDIEELKRQGLSIRAISGLTGYDRKTIRKYLIHPESAPAYGPRPAAPSKLDAFKPYLDERLKAGVWNAQVLLRELRARAPFPSPEILQNGPRRQGSTSSRKTSAALTAPGRTVPTNLEKQGEITGESSV